MRPLTDLVGVFVATTGNARMRRVVGVVRNRVVYSKGGDRLYSCSARTFATWIREARGIRVDEQDPQDLHLA